MKNQYFGDIGDYGKYSLLRAFAKEGIRIGVNWYLTKNDDSSDGGFIRYLDKESEKVYDPELFECLKQMVDLKKRDVELFEAKDMISDAIYYHDELDITQFRGIKEKQAERSRWHNAAMKALQDPELIFLDPDNGLKDIEKSAQKDSVKYAFAIEAATYFERGQNVVYYCHKGRRTPSQWETAKKIMLRHVPEAVLVALTFHRGTQRTYIFVIHKESFERYDQIINSFVESRWGECFEIEPINNSFSGMYSGFSGPIYGTIIPAGYIKKENEDGTITYVPAVEGISDTLRKDFETAEQIYIFAWDVLEKEPASADDEYGFYVLAYYAKIYVDFKAIYVLLQNGLLDQARVILRTMLEKLFILKGILNDGNLDDYKRWNVIEKKNRIQNIRSGYVGLESLKEKVDDLERGLRKQAEELGVNYDKDKTVSTREWAKKADMMEWRNLIYKDLSASVHANDNIFKDSTIVDEDGKIAISMLPNNEDTSDYLGCAAEILLRAHKSVADYFKIDIPNNDYYDMFEIR